MAINFRRKFLEINQDDDKIELTINDNDRLIKYKINITNELKEYYLNNIVLDIYKLSIKHRYRQKFKENA